MKLLRTSAVSAWTVYNLFFGRCFIGFEQFRQHLLSSKKSPLNSYRENWFAGLCGTIDNEIIIIAHAIFDRMREGLSGRSGQRSRRASASARGRVERVTERSA